MNTLIPMLTAVLPAHAGHATQPSSAVDSALIDSVASAGIAREDLLQNLRGFSYSSTLDFVEAHGWKRVNDPSNAVWVFEVGGPDEKAPLQRVYLTRRDGDVILDTMDARFAQRLVLEHGRVVFNSGRRPRTLIGRA